MSIVSVCWMCGEPGEPYWMEYRCRDCDVSWSGPVVAPLSTSEVPGSGMTDNDTTT